MNVAMHSEQKYDLEHRSTLLFEQQEIPFTQSEWKQLAEILANSDYQHIVGGDANESHSVWVSRYFNDIETPQALNDLANEVEAIVMSNKMLAFYQRFTGTDKLCLRRCQANRLLAGDYIGLHKDQDSSPEYLATIVFHFSNDYTGGNFQTVGMSNQPCSSKPRLYKRLHKRLYKPRAYTALVNSCSIPHQVTKVKSGERLTLACFLSTSFVENKKRRYAFKINNNSTKRE